MQPKETNTLSVNCLCFLCLFSISQTTVLGLHHSIILCCWSSPCPLHSQMPESLTALKGCASDLHVGDARSGKLVHPQDSELHVPPGTGASLELSVLTCTCQGRNWPDRGDPQRLRALENDQVVGLFINRRRDKKTPFLCVFTGKKKEGMPRS